MPVTFARAFALGIGVLLASSALAQDSAPLNRRSRDSYVVEQDQIIRPEPPASDRSRPSERFFNAGNDAPSPRSSYYSQSSSDRFFNAADEIQTPAPVEHGPALGNSANTCGSCNACNGCDMCDACNGFCDNCCASCQQCPCSGWVLFSGIDSWHGIGDRANNGTPPSNNDGSSFGFNYGTRLGGFSDMTGIGLQIGGSYGLYDFNGRQDTPGVLTTTQVQQQGFLTAGLFKKANGCCNWSFGVVHDWMFNQAWGAFAVNPTLGQWRGQVAYATSAWNEFGAWGTLRDKGDSNLDSLGNPVNTRPIDQVNLFWHHKWEFGGDSWIWAGFPPHQGRLDQTANGGGTLGDFLVGGSVIAPLNDYLALYGNMQYMHPSAAAGSIGSGESAWYVAFGLQYYIGGSARTSTVAGNCWLPLMPLANNGNFLVDSVH